MQRIAGRDAVESGTGTSASRKRAFDPRRYERWRGLVLAGLAALATESGAQSGMTGQGIFPGNPAPDAFKLPYDFEPVIRLRTFYKKTETFTGAEQQAWALGGFAGLRSPWFGDLFQFGVVGY